MLIAPNLVIAAVGVLQCGLNTVDGDCLDVVIVDEIGKSDISDCALVLLDGLKKGTGVIGLEGSVGGFLFSVQEELGLVTRRMSSSGPPTSLQLVVLPVKMEIS